MNPTPEQFADAAMRRISTRSYTGAPVDHHAVTTLITSTPLPWGERIAIGAAFGVGGGVTSTYGVISGTRDYLLLTASGSATDRDIMAGAYAMERIVLKATLAGLGTCWIGGTFNRNRFSDSTGLATGKRIVCVVAIGHPAPRRRLVERAMRAIARSSRRKPADQLFFANDIHHPYPTGGSLSAAFSLVRLAPSAVNRQPWRIIADNDPAATARLYSLPDKGFGAVEMGIAMSHFDLLLPPAPWNFDTNDIPSLPGLTFIASRPTTPALRPGPQ